MNHETTDETTDNDTGAAMPYPGYIDERTWRTVTGRPQNPTVPLKTKTPREIQDELEAGADAGAGATAD